MSEYRLQTDLSKEAYAENLAKIASELSVLEPIQQGEFFEPNLIQKQYVHEEILCCLNIGFILTCLKKLMLRIWQRLLHNLALQNLFRKRSSFCPISFKNLIYMKYFCDDSLQALSLLVSSCLCCYFGIDFFRSFRFCSS